jgi:3-hydroxy-9,10-secoandrosta-1,3,5(10)-triene-9,17-dione monooxygenase reductase component
MTDLRSAELKAVFGHFATGVTIVTADVDGRPHGFTCQSFVALSMAPAYVAFCPARSSTSWPRIRTAGSVCINVLASEQESVCRAFADRGRDRFAGVPWRAAENGAPVLDNTLAYIEADIVDELEAGDHTIVVAAPTTVQASPNGNPLLYYRGAFGCPHEEG